MERLCLPVRAAAQRRTLPIVVTALGTVAYLAATLWVLPEVNHRPSEWFIAPDAWANFQLAHLVFVGAYSTVYASGTFLAPPAILLVLAPVWELGHALGLVTGYGVDVPRPDAWFVLEPASTLLCSFALFGADALAEQLGASRRRRAGLCLVLAVSLFSVLQFGHPEDAVAIGFVLYAVGQAVKGEWTRCAWLLAGAFAFQPLAVLAIPIVLGAAPLRRLPGLVGRIALPTALMLIGPMIVDPHQTILALVDQPAFPALGRPTPWLHLTHPLVDAASRLPTVSGGTSRTIALAAALALGVVVHHRRPLPATLVWLVACSLGLREAFDAVVLPYYTWPCVAVALVAASIWGWRSFAATGLASVVAVSVASNGGANSTTLWWWTLAAMVVVIVCSSGALEGRASRSPAADTAEATGRPGPGGQLAGPEIGDLARS